MFSYRTSYSERTRNFEFTDERVNNYKNVNLVATVEGRIKSDVSILENQKNTDAFSSRIEETRSLKTFSLFTLRSNIFKPLEQSSERSFVAPLVQGSKYVLYNDNGKNFIMDKADFEELIDIFNSKSTFSHRNPNFEFFENRSYNEACHFYPMSTNASKEEDKGANETTVDNHTEDMKENIVYSSQKKNMF
ncbi:hypothetical protein TNIN_285321 [Trichonephila inaurata madagascariensis]|uniref:Uncharacterized protein n=1 Tax=Trichonephila inaurata madagascariensis TaxID=2747483 RepID=A0A8X7BST3_9ARAC|nr:hypothetical protein TNIN_285321 [Trichonephila inaurata madagascariensis]